MNISGAAGILKTASNISLAGTLSVSASNPSLEGGTVALSGGTLKADNDITVKSDLTSQADSSISVAAGKKITYTGNKFKIGTHSLTISGTGSFENTGSLALDNSTSVLSLNGILKLKHFNHRRPDLRETGGSAGHSDRNTFTLRIFTYRYCKPENANSSQCSRNS